MVDTNRIGDEMIETYSHTCYRQISDTPKPVAVINGDGTYNIVEESKQTESGRELREYSTLKTLKAAMTKMGLKCVTVS